MDLSKYSLDELLYMKKQISKEICERDKIKCKSILFNIGDEVCWKNEKIGKVQQGIIRVKKEYAATIIGNGMIGIVAVPWKKLTKKGDCRGC